MPPYLTLSIIRYRSRVSRAIQGKKKSSPLHLGEKEAFRLPSTTVGQIIYIKYIYFLIINKCNYCTVSLFNGISTFLGYSMPKPSFEKNRRKDKGLHTFPKSICRKVNVVKWLEFELAYYDSTGRRFNHYTTRTSLNYCTFKNSRYNFKN